MATDGGLDAAIHDLFGDPLDAYDVALLPLPPEEMTCLDQQAAGASLQDLLARPDSSTSLQLDTLNLFPSSSAYPGGTLYPLLDTFLDCLHASMPFFMRSYLVDGITARRHHSSRAFDALLHAICALTLLQPVQGGRSLRQDRAQWAEQLMARAIELHAHVNFGQEPTLEDVMTSVFLFGCYFCRNAHNAAKVRLREAVALADVMGLYDPASYQLVYAEEKDCRVRTLVVLTVIERIYAIQRSYTLDFHLLGGREIGQLLEGTMRSAAAGDETDYKAVEGLRHMIQQVDFIDNSVLRCWKETCGLDVEAGGSGAGAGGGRQQRHVPASTIRSLLVRYAAPPAMHALLSESQLADITITRHWVMHVLWKLGFRHGYVDAASLDPEMRPDYALDIAHNAALTCERFSVKSLEVHGVGLAEKLYDIAMSALLVAESYYFSSAYHSGSSDQAPLREEEENSDGNDVFAGFETAGATGPALAPVLPTTHGAGWRGRWTRVAIRRLLNKYLAIFSLFRGGEHPFLRPYMQMLCVLDTGGADSV
ncbi:uncharacterized protein DNG_07249 [Cephalotrichum gorgonifer]|uniref:Transcription factor domain-containing protein n=1 Tax=Cephalotrichum gorgonifer TaxID=2041049 RepID=A0AAE8N2Z9_9PEZI|nr:uncharacterized protein DNG_07249 [Cephalotrichum gorgonifer]